MVGCLSMIGGRASGDWQAFIGFRKLFPNLLPGKKEYPSGHR
ncbi:hypothetical protein BDD14_1406 [Edaphobacter modestus]|uniref:Uncharacterized protein n=1 Tax=Edaphobacter modestus TaxID=388466 RepID=A0A4Q7YSQ9_9BACT|nr:hypothetical protein BDD14_1406 [Edaphobacter modestus]